jgi:6-pyruvoyl-tetrahydropterin synthase related domain
MMVTASAVVAPMLWRGTASGHDLQFHLASWIDVLGQWREGLIYPRWAEWANFGFGEPRFIFYPPVSWMLGASLGALVPWRMAPGVYIWLALIVAGMSMRRLALEWVSGNAAILAGVLFAVNPYTLITVYYRSDFAELLASALVPLLLWLALRAMRGEGRAAPWLALAFAAIWLTNAPEGVLATYSLVLVALVSSISARAARPFVAVAASMAGGFALAAFYILPAAYEQRWVQIAQAVTDELRPGENFLFTHAGDSDFILFNHKVSWAAVGLIVVTAISAFFAARKRRGAPDLWRALCVLAVVAVVLLMPASLPLWRFVPKLAFVQFPWRWLEILGLAFALFVAAGYSQARQPWLARGAVVALLAGILCAAAAMVKDAWWDSQDAPVLLSAIHGARGYEGTDEYMPIGCDRSELPGNPDDTTRADDASPTPELPVEEVNPDDDTIVPVRDAQVAVERWSSERKAFHSQAATSVTLAVRLLEYPAWRARIDGREAHLAARPVTTQLLLDVPAGSHEVTIDFERTGDRTAGDAISLASGCGLIGWALVLRKRRTG